MRLPCLQIPDSFKFTYRLKKVHSVLRSTQTLGSNVGATNERGTRRRHSRGGGAPSFPVHPVLSCACMTSKRRLRRLSAQKNDSLSCKKCDTYISLLTMLSLCFADLLILLLIYGVIEGSILARKVSLVVSLLILSINDLCKI